MLTSEKYLQQLYTVQVKISYSELNLDEDFTYQNLIKSKQWINSETANVKKEVNKEKAYIAKDKRVVKAREQVNKAFAKYVEEPSRDNQQLLQNEKEHLKICYNQVIEEDIHREFQLSSLIWTSTPNFYNWRVKTKLKTGKSGEDGIPPEILKTCDLDEIILGYATTPFS